MAERALRIGVLTSVHPPFDARIFHREAKAAVAMGARVTLIAPGARQGAVDGIALQSLPAWGGRWARPLHWPVLFWKALRLRADIYHIHDPELLPWGLLIRWIARKPVVYDSHEYLRESVETKHWIPARLRSTVSRGADWLEKRIAHRLSAVVAVTDDMAERFRPYQPNVTVVMNLPPAAAIQDEPPSREPVVIYAGLMDVGRGLDILHETARLVRGRVPEARFEIVGNVEWHGVEESIRALRPEDWEAAGVRFAGIVPFEEVGPRLARASVGWLPLSPREGNYLLAWPIKLVEYMAAGLPVVASNLPIPSAVLERERCGVAVEALSPGAHADAIVEFLQNAGRAREMGEAGRLAARQHYTWEGEARKLQRLYKELSADTA